MPELAVPPPPGAQGARAAIRRHATPALVLLAGAVGILARVLAAPTQRLPGLETGDVYKHCWSFWHLLHQLGRGDWPWTGQLDHPSGGVLLDIMSLPALIMAPLTAVAGPVLATNAWVLLSLLACGLACYALALGLGAHRIGAVGAGLLVQSSAIVIGHALTSGVLERLALWVFPVVALGLLYASPRRPGRALVVALAAGAAALHSPSYGTHLVVVCLALGGTLALIPGPRPSGERLRGLLLQLGLVGLALGAVLLLHRGFVLSPESLAGVPSERVRAGLGLAPGRFEVASLRTLLDPVFAATQRTKRIDDELVISSYLGWAWLAVFAGGAWAAWRGRRWRSLAVLGVAALLLALCLGPFLRLGDRALLNPLYAMVAAAVPYYARMPAPWQQVGAAGALGAVALAELVRILPRRRLTAGVALAVALVWAERAVVLPVPVVVQAADASIPAAYDQARPPGALADIPHMWRGSELFSGKPFLAQTRHRLPMPWAINVGRSDWDDYAPLQHGRTEDWPGATACLWERGFRWLALHRDWYPEPAAAQAAAEGLAKVLGPASADDGVVLLFALTEPAPAAGALPLDCPEPSEVSP